jgi:hypothetical protein
MPISEASLQGILDIGRECSIRGSGRSLAAMLSETNYLKLRPNIGPSHLLPLIRSNAQLVEDWIMYSQDKRTSGGWYIVDRQVGRVGDPKSVRAFPTVHDAVAYYVVAELDFWSVGSDV